MLSMSHAITVRPARADELDVVIDLAQRLVDFDRGFDPTLSATWTSTDEAREFYTDRIAGDGVALLAFDGSRALGVLTASLEAEDYSHRTVGTVAELEILYVDPDARGRGAGKALVLAFTAWARAAGATRLRVNASHENVGAIAFYRGLGFVDYDVVLECDPPPV